MATRLPRKSGGRDNLIGAILIGGVGLVVAAAVAGVWLIGSGDSNTCRADSPAPHLIVLVDGTDEILPVQQDAAINYVEQLVHAAPRGGRVSIYRLNETESDPVTLIETRCNLGRGAETNPLEESQGVAEARFHVQFEAPLRRAFEGSVVGGNANASPILEALQRIAVETARDANGGRRGDVYLLILSDMIQHSNCLSHYREQPDFETYQQRDCYRLLRASLNHAQVCVRVVPRANRSNVQSQGYVESFWARSFRDMDAAPGFGFCANPTNCSACAPVWE